MTVSGSNSCVSLTRRCTDRRRVCRATGSSWRNKCKNCHSAVSRPNEISQSLFQCQDDSFASFSCSVVLVHLIVICSPRAQCYFSVWLLFAVLVLCCSISVVYSCCVLLCIQISNRLMLALSLLKKEYELSKLQQKIGKEVCILVPYHTTSRQLERHAVHVYMHWCNVEATKNLCHGRILWKSDSSYFCFIFISAYYLILIILIITFIILYYN